MTHLNVNEIFGPTIQGEGIHAGRLVGFLRLAGCNLACSWCDTPYSWDWSRYDKKAESHQWDLIDVAKKLDDMAVETVIITGGEPMLQQRGITALKKMLPMMDFEVETNGTIRPTEPMIEAIALFAVSPKLAHGGDAEKDRKKHEALAAFAQRAWDGQAIFKFVAQQVSDLDEVAATVREFRIPRESIWIMPEGANPATHLESLERVADAVVARGWNLTTRLHLLAWGSKRGV